MNKYPIAWWSAAVAFFATVLAIGTIDIFNPSDDARLLSSVVVGIITGGAVYAKERLNAAKLEDGKYAGDIVVTETDDKMQYALEIHGNPEDVIKPKSDVLFKVIKKP